MDCHIRPAAPEDVRTALELARAVFMEFEAPLYSPEAISKFVDGCVYNEKYISNYTSGSHLMYIAEDIGKTVGMTCERGGGRISMLFVDKAYHRQGIATVLMDRIIKSMREKGECRITLHSSPYGVPFYTRYGFVKSAEEQSVDGFIITPMYMDI